MNRYTQLSSASYNPMTLQELMLAPSYLRQKYDENQNTIAGFETELAKFNPLDVHADLTSARQKELYDELSGFSEELATNGFTNLNKSNLIKFNKKYQSEISPTGLLGKANAAKSAYIENFNNYIEDATKNKKWSREDAIRNWNKFQQNYTGFDQSGNITNIGQLGAPEKVDLMTKLKAAKDILGEQVVNELGAGNYSIQPQQDGSLHVINRSGRRIETSNAPNIQNALKMFNSELSDPNSAWRQSIEFEGLDTGQLANQINSGFAAMLSNKVSDNRSQNLSVIGYKNRIDEAYDNKEIDFEKWTGENINLFNKKGINKLESIINGGTENVYPNKYRASEVIIPTTQKVKSTLENLDEPTERMVKTVFEGLKLRGDLDNNASLEDKNVLKTVKKYMQDFTTETNTPKIITEKDIKSAKEKSDKIVLQAKSRNFYDIKTGETYSYNDMLDLGYFTGDVRKDQLKTSYRGQLSSDNRINTMLSEEQSDNYAMPHVISVYKEGSNKPIEFLVPGSESEIKSPWYQKELKFNKEYNKLLPGLPKPYQWKYQDENGTNINREITITSQSDNTYVIEGRSLKDPTKIQRETVTQDELKEMFSELKAK